MGCAQSSEVQVTKNKLTLLNDELNAAGYKPVDPNAIKLLLLGAGESGKSTLFKQMKVIHQGGYSPQELKEYVAVIHPNILHAVDTLMEAFKKLHVDMPEDVSLLHQEFKAKTSITLDERIDPDFGALLGKMWAHEAVQQIYDRQAEFQLPDSTAYFLKDINRIASSDYEPTEQDVLRSRVRTTGIVQNDFKIKGFNFCMFDLGGQRAERRKWINAFSAVDAVVFVAALSEYDQVLAEDETKNRLDESVYLFSQLCNSKWFTNTSMLLFLNKRDIFEEKIKKKPLKQFYPPAQEDDALTDDTDFDQCSAYMTRLYLAQNRNPKKSVYTHITCATDTNNVKFVFTAVVGIILEENLKSSGVV